jgi:hypothetical protein
MGGYSKQHFSDEQWADYVRHVLPASAVAEIQRHLDSGCEECGQAARFWSAFAEVGARAFAFEPPADTVRAVELSFRTRDFTTERRKRTTLAQLIFDSMRQPAPAGVRGSKHSPRRMISRAGRWVIDLHVEQAAGKKLIITGQVINESRARGLEPVPIALMRGQTVLDTSSTNQFGEFQISGEVGSGLHLYIDVPTRTAIEVPLPVEE